MALLFIATQGSQAQELYVTLAALPVLLLQHSNIRFDFGILNSVQHQCAASLAPFHQSARGLPESGPPKAGAVRSCGR